MSTKKAKELLNEALNTLYDDPGMAQVLIRDALDALGKLQPISDDEMEQMAHEEYRILEARLIEEQWKNGDRLHPGHWAKVAARKVVSHLRDLGFTRMHSLKHQLGVVTSTEDAAFNALVDIICDKLLTAGPGTVFMGSKLNEVVKRMYPDGAASTPSLTVDKAIEAAKGWVMSVAECRDETEWNDRHWQKVVSDLRARLEQAAEQQ